MAVHFGRWVVGTLAATAVGIGVAASPLGHSIERLVTHAVWSAQNPSSDPDCKDPGYLDELKPDGATANSTLQPDVDRYDAKYTLDRDPTTAWAQDRFGKRGSGRDAVAWQFDKPVDIALICVRNGFQKNNFTYADTGLVKQLRLERCGTSRTVDIATPPWGQETTDDFQPLRVDCTTDAVRFVILDTENAHHNGQVSLSDVVFYG